MQIKFLHQCDVDGDRYVVGQEADASTLPADWVKSALLAEFVAEVPPPGPADQTWPAKQPTPAKKNPPPSDPPPGPDKASS